jgi:hypothetical protein
VGGRLCATARCCRRGRYGLSYSRGVRLDGGVREYAGRLRTERSMRLPRRMYSLGRGSWPGFVSWSLDSVLQRRFWRLQAVKEDVGLIAYGQICFATRRLEIRRIPCRLLEGGRLPAVSSEGADPSPLDSGTALGTCETGGLG